MKKMTKILSLVLALAMVLGMTAFAGTPSTLILIDDFSDVTDLSFDTFKATRTVVADSTFSAVESVALAGAPAGATKFYSTATTPTFVNENGKIKLASSDMQLVYRLPTAWTYTEHPNETLIASLNVEYNYVQDRSAYQILRPMLKEKTKDTTVEGAGDFNGDGAVDVDANGFVLDENGKLILTEKTSGNSSNYTFSRIKGNSTGYDFNSSYRREMPDYCLTYGEPVNFSSVFKAAKMGYSTTARTSLVVADAPAYSFAYGKNMDTNMKVAIEEVNGFKVRTTSYLSTKYESFKVYSVSNDANDIYIDADSTETANVPVEGSFDIIMSQPILETYYSTPSGGGADDVAAEWLLEDAVTITDGTNTLSKANGDFTVKVSEKVVGTAVKGVITINLLKPLAYGTTYTLAIPSTRVFNLSCLRASAGQSIEFTTQAAPSFNITLSGYEGLRVGTTQIAAGEMAGKTVFFTANATNTTGRAIDGVLAIGIYEGDTLVKYAYANKAFANAGNGSFSAAFKVGEGQTVKAFVKGVAASEVTFGN